MNQAVHRQLAFLRQTFLQDARVLDVRQGYISVSPFNLRMRPEVLKAASTVIAHEFADQEVDVIHGIPHSGNYLATAVALKFGRGVRLHSSRKDQHVPVSWRDVFRREVRSFTTSGEGITVYSGINLSFVSQDEKVLVIDDVCATGHTGTTIIKGLQDHGVQVLGFAVLFDKVFQGGLEAVARLGVKAFSCVRVEKITPGGQIRLLALEKKSR